MAHEVGCVALQEWLQALAMVAEELTCTLQEVAERLGADPAQLPGEALWPGLGHRQASCKRCQRVK